MWRQPRGENPLTFLCALLEGVIDLLEHGLAALLEGWQHDALKRFPVSRLDGPLQGIGRGPHNGVCKVLASTQRKDSRK